MHLPRRPVGTATSARALPGPPVPPPPVTHPLCINAPPAPQPIYPFSAPPPGQSCGSAVPAAATAPSPFPSVPLSYLPPARPPLRGPPPASGTTSARPALRGSRHRSLPGRLSAGPPSRAAPSRAGSRAPPHPMRGAAPPAEADGRPRSPGSRRRCKSVAADLLQHRRRWGGGVGSAGRGAGPGPARCRAQGGGGPAGRQSCRGLRAGAARGRRCPQRGQIRARGALRCHPGWSRGCPAGPRHKRSPGPSPLRPEHRVCRHRAAGGWASAVAKCLSGTRLSSESAGSG